MGDQIVGILVEMNGEATKKAIAEAMGKDQKTVDEVVSEMAKLGRFTVSGDIVKLKK
jgi:Mn-dependent DtxR family transcriptional regulator